MKRTRFLFLLLSLLVLLSFVVGCGSDSRGGSDPSVFPTGLNPKVIGYTPVDGTTNVTTITPVVVTFDSVMGVVDATNLSCTANNGSYVTQLVYTADSTGKIFSATPAGGWLSGTEHTCTLGTVYSSAWLPTIGTITWSFTTAGTPGSADTTAPLVYVPGTPVGSGVAPNTPINIPFSEAVSCTSVSSGGVIFTPSLAGTWVCSGSTATFTPSGQLYSTTYTVNVTTAVADLAGNNLATAASWSYSTASAPDVTPPTLQSWTPTGSTVAPNTPITTTYSEAMNCASISSGGVIITPSLGGTWVCSGSTATFTPASQLYSTTYNVDVTTAVTDLAGNNLAAAWNWSYTTTSAPDVTPPTFLDSLKTPVGSGVAPNTPINLPFSEAVSCASVSSGGVIFTPSLAGTWVCSGSTATFTPSGQLYSTTYSVDVTTAVIDLAGNNLATAASWSYSTASAPDVTPPTIQSWTPTGLTVALNTPIALTFDEAVNCATISGGGVTITPSLGGTWVCSGSTATFTPVGQLYSTTYNVDVTTAVADLAGNNLATAWNWSYTTVDSSSGLPFSYVSPNQTVVPGTDISFVLDGVTSGASCTVVNAPVATTPTLIYNSSGAVVSFPTSASIPGLYETICSAGGETARMTVVTTTTADTTQTTLSSVLNLTSGTTAAATFNSSTGALSVASLGSERWHIQLFESLPALVAGGIYEVEFVISGGGSMDWLLQNSSGPNYTHYDDANRAIPCDGTVRVLHFQAPVSDSNARLSIMPRYIGIYTFTYIKVRRIL